MAIIRIAVFVSMAVFFLYRIVFWWLHPLTIWSDQSVYLAMGQLILAGRTPYVDFFDFNTPLIIYLSTLPSMLAAVSCMPVSLAFVIAVYGLLAFSLAIIWRLFDDNKEQWHYRLRWSLLFALILFTQLQKSDFGQREHLFMLLLAPYIVLRCLRLEGGRAPQALAVLIGVCAAVGTNIKPLFLEVFIVFELALLLSGARPKALLTPEIKAFFITSVSYLIALLFLPEAARSVFLNQALPIYTSGLAAFSNSVISGLDTDAAFSVPIYLMVVQLILSSVLLTKSRWLLPMSALVLISFVIYLQAGLVWTYRMMPLEASLAMLGGVQLGIGWDWLCNRFSRAPARDLIRIFASLILAMVTLPWCWWQVQSYVADIKNTDMFALSNIGYGGQCPESDLDAVFYTILKHSFKDDSVVVIGPAVLPGYPAVLLSGRHFGSRYLHGMILPMLHFCRQNHPDEKRFADMERQVIDNYGFDIEHNKPRLVFIADDFVRPQLDRYNFVRTYLKNYQSLGHLHQFKYEVFKLEDQVAAGAAAVVHWPVEKRRQLVLKILSEMITSEEAARNSGLSASQINDWVKRADQALRQSLADNPGGGEIELKSQVLESMARERLLEDKVKALERRIDYLKAHPRD